MATHSSILAWRIPWTEEPGALPSMRSQRVRHDWSDCTHTHILTHKGYLYSLNTAIIWSYLYDLNYWRRKWNPLIYSWLENSIDREAWQVAIHGVTKNQTGLSTTFTSLTWSQSSFPKDTFFFLLNKETNRDFALEKTCKHHLIEWSKLISLGMDKSTSCASWDDLCYFCGIPEKNA